MIDAEKAPELMLQAGRDAEQAGDLETALRAYTDALAGMDVGGSLATRAEILRCMARVYHKRGDYNEALDAAQRSLDLADQSDEPEQVVAALNAVAISEQFLGRLDRAQSLYQRRHQLLFVDNDDMRFRKQGRGQRISWPCRDEHRSGVRDGAVAARDPNTHLRVRLTSCRHPGHLELVHRKTINGLPAHHLVDRACAQHLNKVIG